MGPPQEKQQGPLVPLRCPCNSSAGAPAHRLSAGRAAWPCRPARERERTGPKKRARDGSGKSPARPPRRPREPRANARVEAADWQVCMLVPPSGARRDSRPAGSINYAGAPSVCSERAPVDEVGTTANPRSEAGSALVAETPSPRRRAARWNKQRGDTCSLLLRGLADSRPAGSIRYALTCSRGPAIDAPCSPRRLFSSLGVADGLEQPLPETVARQEGACSPSGADTLARRWSGGHGNAQLA